VSYGNTSGRIDQRQATECCVLNPLTPNVAIMGTAIMHPVLDRVKPSFVIFDIRALWWASECPDVKNYKRRLKLVWHMMLLYSFLCFGWVGSTTGSASD